MLKKAKRPAMAAAGIIMLLAAGSSAAQAGMPETDISSGGAGTAVLSRPEGQEPGPTGRQVAVDDHWHGHGYGPYPYPGPYWRPRPPAVIVAPAPVIVAPAPVYAYPAPVVVPAPVPVTNQVVCRGSNNGAILGGAIGGVTGAAIGATASHHSWEAATGGAILGILLGSAVGHAVDAGDQYCTTQAVIAAPVGRPVYWANPAYGRQYQVIPLRQYQAWGTTCRDYQASALVNGRWQQIRGTTCVQPDGSWQPVAGR